MSHIRMSHGTHMNGSCHTWMSHTAHMTESCNTRTTESCHTYIWVMSHMWLNHATHMTESCHMAGSSRESWLQLQQVALQPALRPTSSSHWVMSQACHTHVTESCHTHVTESCHTHDIQAVRMKVGYQVEWLNRLRAVRWWSPWDSDDTVRDILMIHFVDILMIEFVKLDDTVREILMIQSVRFWWYTLWCSDDKICEIRWYSSWDSNDIVCEILVIHFVDILMIEFVKLDDTVREILMIKFVRF